VTSKAQSRSNAATINVDYGLVLARRPEQPVGSRLDHDRKENGAMIRGIALSLVVLTTSASLAAGRAQAPDAANPCQTNLKGLGRALELYVNDYNGKFPKAASFEALMPELRPYGGKPKAANCPVTGKVYQFNTALSGAAANSIHKPAETPVIRDSAPHPDGSVTFVYADFHVKQWPAAQARTEISKGKWK
jgi:hypothetical protein